MLTMYLDYPLSIIIVICSALLGGTMATFLGCINSTKKICSVKDSIFFSKFPEIIVLSIIFYLFTEGSDSILIVIGHSIYAVIIPLQMMYRDIYIGRHRELFNITPSIFTVFATNLAKGLITSGVVLGWVNGLTPLTLTFLYVIFMITIAMHNGSKPQFVLSNE